jgi:flavodoxin
MKVEVRYYSRGGNTKKVADAIAQAIGAEAKDCSVPISEAVELLFLGGSVYGFGLDDHTKDFIAGLNPERIRRVALFGTSAIVKTGNRDMAKSLNEKGIEVMQRDFYCRGAFTVMHRGHPNDNDLKQAAAFAHAALEAIGC